MANDKIDFVSEHSDILECSERNLKGSESMRRIDKLICLVLVFITFFTYTAFAENEIENNSSTETKVEAEVDIDDSDAANKIVDKLETLLDPENNELEKEVTDTLEKHSDNWLVKFFKTIIDAISSFLDALFKLASEAAKIGVD